MTFLLGSWAGTTSSKTEFLNFHRDLLPPKCPTFREGLKIPAREEELLCPPLALLLLSHGTPNLSSTPVSSILTTPHSASYHCLDFEHPSPSHHLTSPGPLLLVFLLLSPSHCSHSISIKARSYFLCSKPTTGGKQTIKPYHNGFPSEMWISQMTCKVLKGLYNPLRLPCNQPLTASLMVLQPCGPLCVVCTTVLGMHKSS